MANSHSVHFSSTFDYGLRSAVTRKLEIFTEKVNIGSSITIQRISENGEKTVSRFGRNKPKEFSPDNKQII